MRTRTLSDNESPFVELTNGTFIVTNRNDEPIGNDYISEQEMQSYFDVSEEEIEKDSPFSDTPNNGELSTTQEDLEEDRIVHEYESTHAIEIP